jgi:hypothetical protein
MIIDCSLHVRDEKFPQNFRTLEGKRWLGIPCRRLEDDSNVDIVRLWAGLHGGQDSELWLPVRNMVMSPRVP